VLLRRPAVLLLDDRDVGHDGLARHALEVQHQFTVVTVTGNERAMAVLRPPAAWKTSRLDTWAVPFTETLNTRAPGRSTDGSRKPSVTWYVPFATGTR
jgi:hypothetical protein